MHFHGTYVYGLTLYVVIYAIRHIVSVDNSEKIYVQKNMTEIRLNCSTTTEVAWLLGGTVLTQGGSKITTDHRIQLIIDTLTKTLHIKDIASNYSGVYSCLHFDKGEITNTTLAIYDVIVVEHLTIIEKNVTLDIIEGTNEKLKCLVDGRPEPAIRWYIVHNPGETETLIDIGIMGKILEIINFTRECAMSYKCEAYNGFSNESSVIHTFPKFSPEVSLFGPGANRTSDGIQISVRMNSKLNFTCIVEARPFVNMTITRNNMILVSFTSENPEKPVLNETDSTIYEYVFTPKIDIDKKPYTTYSVTTTGVFVNEIMFSIYKCTSVNDFGSDEKTINVVKLSD